VTTVQAAAAGIAPTARRRAGRWAPGLAGLAVLCIVWHLLAVTWLSKGGAVPTPWAVLQGLVADDGWDFYQPHVQATVFEATRGFLWGNVLALATALVVLLVPQLETMAMQLAVASYCLPLMAIGPILTIVFGGRTPMIALAALSVYFTTLVSVLLGLRTAQPTSLDLVRAYGGGRWQQLWRVRAVSALPGLLAGLQVAAPAAVLGAIIGEFLGQVQTGLGVAMVISQQQLEVARTWGIAAVAAVIAGLAYAAFGLAARLATPWATGARGPA
jgi:ABC-type nitrate/sulfonate/bicarbonate transport system permease component